MAAWYCNAGNGSTTGYYAITQWAALTANSLGDLRRQLAAPGVGNERVFRCTTAGTTGAAEPAWTLTKGATTADGSAVWTEVTGNSAYGWTACHARLANATSSSWAAAGDTVYIASASQETQAAAMTITSSGSQTAPLQIICVNAAGSVPPVAADVTTGATVTTTGANAIALQSNNYVYGVSFVSGSNISFPTGDWLESCNLSIASSTIGNAGSTTLILKDTTVNFGAATCSFSISGGLVKWFGASSALTGTGPNSLVTNLSQGSTLIIDGVDLSLVASGKNLCSAGTGVGATATFNNCKLASGVAVSSGSPSQAQSPRIDLTNSDSAATDYRFERYMTQGALTTETTIVKTSPAGASDGTTPLSWKIVTTASNWFFAPFECIDILAWASAAAHTATIELITDNVILTNADVWAEVEYMGSAGSPLGALASSRTANILTAGTNLGTSAATWTTTGLTTPKPQNFTVSFTPAIAGYVRIRIKVAKVSTTLRVDPYPAIT